MDRSSRPRVDVGVVTWNTAELTARALRRLLDSDQACDIRLLIRDNASTDGTVETLSRLVPEAEIDAGSENLGFAAGVNRLLARSDAPWFFLLNSDAWPEPGAIGRLIETARLYPKVAAVAPRIEDPDGVLEHSTHPFPSLRIAWLLTFRRRRLPPKVAEELLLVGAWNHDRPRVVEWAVGAALLIPREAIVDVGGFDERFFLYAEDVEWCWRAHRRGWDIRFEPEALIRHVGNASGKQNYGAKRTAAYHRNTYRFYRREHGLFAELAYRVLNLAGATSQYLSAKRAGDFSRAAYWPPHIRAHLTPAFGPDGPPKTRPAK